MSPIEFRPKLQMTQNTPPRPEITVVLANFLCVRRNSGGNATSPSILADGRILEVPNWNRLPGHPLYMPALLLISDQRRSTCLKGRSREN